MVATDSKIRTIVDMVKHLPAELLQQLLCVQCRMRTSVVVEQFPSNNSLFQHLKRLLEKQHFPTDDDVEPGWLRSPATNLFDTGVQKLISRASIPAFLMLREISILKEASVARWCILNVGELQLDGSGSRRDSSTRREYGHSVC
ncbi:hypothetical protein AVEN_208912-1 [Araneus ventricosus]|uniref:Uncharacterized protein n=1 Tax=Araneus ventricosus TaxID=182803 RepID=A0A4Y2F2L3_ARAVE|nr:hypothetical protein AVEN_208912-1 [Araneus ventricosus]